MLDNWIANKIDATEPLERAALEKWQLERLRETVALAYTKSPFYRERLGIVEINALPDISRLPTFSARELKEQGSRMLCVGADEIERIVTLETSGSTGGVKRVYFSKNDQELTVDFFHRGMMNVTNPGDTVLILFRDGGEGALTDLLSRGLVRMGAKPVVFGFPKAEMYPAVVDLIIDIGVSTIVGPPEQIAEIAEYSKNVGKDEEISKTLHSVLMAASFVSDKSRRNTAEIWNCEIFEHYGMTETGYIGPLSCGSGGYHIPEADLYYEIIDPATGENLPDGEIGEVVVTTLTRAAMPMIRYRTGDKSRIITKKCPCGSILRRLDRVGSRPYEKKFERDVTIPEEL